MLQRLLEQKAAITVMYASSTGPRISLSALEWCQMKELIQILQPLEEATRELSTEQRVSYSKVIPLLNAILFELRKNVIDDNETQVPDEDETQVPESQGNSVPSSEDMQEVVTGLIASIERRWLSYEENKIYSICSLLDPRFKDFCFYSSALVRAKRLLLSIMHAKSINPVSSIASVVIDAEDDQEDAPVKKKKCL